MGVVRSVVMLLACAVATWAAEDGDAGLMFLKNEHIELGVLPQAAGRVVILRRPGGHNILSSGPAQWQGIPDATGHSDFVDIGGHMLWVAPQSHWWRQQQHSFRTPASTWPPDPWLIIGRYRVLERGDDALMLEGPSSPVSGLRLVKSYRLDGHRVVVTCTATNTRDTAVSWGLWSNLQVRPSADAFVMTTDATHFELRFAANAKGRSAPMPYSWIGDMLAIPQVRPDPDKDVSGKMFLRQAVSALMAIDADFCLVVRPEVQVSPRDVAPDHAPLEIFRNVPGAGSGTLELEHHGEYRSLKPGEQMSLSESWEVHEFQGGPDLAERAAHAAALATPKAR